MNLDEIQDSVHYVSDEHCTTSWINHVLCSHDIQNKLDSVIIINTLPSSDYLQQSMTFDL